MPGRRAKRSQLTLRETRGGTGPASCGAEPFPSFHCCSRPGPHGLPAPPTPCCQRHRPDDETPVRPRRPSYQPTCGSAVAAGQLLTSASPLRFPSWASSGGGFQAACLPACLLPPRPGMTHRPSLDSSVWSSTRTRHTWSRSGLRAARARQPGSSRGLFGRLGPAPHPTQPLVRGSERAANASARSAAAALLGGGGG